MIKIHYIRSGVFIILLGISSFDLYCFNQKNDISRILDLESDDNGNNPNQAIPELGGQIPESPNAFDSFEQEDTMHSMFNGAQDDLDVSVLRTIEKTRQDGLYMLAVLKNDSTKIKYLLKNKKNNINYQNKYGQTALHYAALYNHEQLIKLLLDNGAQINIVDHLGRTPLHVAVQNDSFQAVETLMHYGAQLNMKDNDDKSPMDYAKSSIMISILSK